MNSPFDEAKYNALLKGLEISILKLSEVQNDNKFFRIDSDYYRKDLIKVLKGNLQLKPFGNFVKDGYRVVYENTKVIESQIAEKKNFPIFLQATDIATPFIKTNSLSYVDESDWIRYPKGRIQRGEILIEVKGKIEKVAIVPDGFSEKTLVSGSLYKLSVNEKINKHFLLVYLLTKFGQAFKERAKTNLLISFVSKHDLYKMPVPIFSDILQLECERLVKENYILSEKSKDLFEEAENLLLKSIGLKDFKPGKEKTNVKNFSESFLSTGRLDAEFYQKKYDYAYEKLKELKPKEIVPLENLLTTITNGQTPLRHDLSKGDVLFLTAEHISDFRINYDSDKRVLSEHHQEKLAKTAIEQNDLLITIKGKIGNVAVVEEVPQPTNINQDVGLLRLKKGVNPYFVAGFINSVLGKLFVEQISTGQINPFLGLGNLRTIPIPIFDNADEIGNRIHQKVIEAEAAQRESKNLLETAKRAVEIAIEETEESAMEFINSEIK